jgi:5'-nucleotidase
MSGRILLTNDDGIWSPGIAVLREALEGLGDVTTIAPATNTSGVARSITIDRPLSLERVTFGAGWSGVACDGTPSDCVRIGFLGIDEPMPDLVVSGVNLGPNMGSDVTYSGTVGAAFEAALRGRPGIAFSVHSRRPGWLAEAAPLLRRIVARVLSRGLPPYTIINVNLPDAPPEAIAGVRPARLGGISLHDRVFLSGDGDGHVPLAVVPFGVCPDPQLEPVADDFDVVAQGYVAVTPLRYALLDEALLCDLHSWDLDGERADA